jgi:hypothetical protein
MLPLPIALAILRICLYWWSVQEEAWLTCLHRGVEGWGQPIRGCGAARFRVEQKAVAIELEYPFRGWIWGVAR